MNITKFFSLTVVGGILLTSASCNSLDDVESLTNESVRLSNYIIPSELTEEITVQNNCMYNMRFDNVSRKMTLGTTDLMLPDGTAVNFVSNEMPFETYAYGDLYSTNFVNGTGRLSNGGELSHLTGYITNIVEVRMPDNDPFINTTIVPLLVAQYKAGNYTVRTFSPNSYFVGKTTTDYQMPGQPESSSFETTTCTYRVNFAQDMKTANVVLYDVKFAQEMPRTLKAVILKSLPVTLTRNGYEISATDIVPEVMEGAEATPYPDYKFSYISIKSSSDLTSIDCEYLVKGIFHGKFSGSCCNHFEISE